MGDALRRGIAVLSCLCALATAANAAGEDALALVKDGQKLLQSGDFAGAQGKFEAALKTDPKLFDAHYAMGRLLDLQGDYTGARRQLEDAIALAPNDTKEQALTSMAVSYVFECKTDEAAKYYQRVFDARNAAQDLDGAASTATALGRVFLECGNFEKAEQWYKTASETAQRIPNLSAEAIDLWAFRMQHAEARLAARRGQIDAARAHAAEAKRVLDKGTNPDQAPQYPYLLGYTDYYAKNYDAALKELADADQKDPFILGLIASAADKIGRKDMAREYYEKVLATTAHSINEAFARPPARKYLSQ
jgi:tetratricopeptide (TPR) repeat protein